MKVRSKYPLLSLLWMSWFVINAQSTNKGNDTSKTSKQNESFRAVHWSIEDGFSSKFWILEKDYVIPNSKTGKK